VTQLATAFGQGTRASRPAAGSGNSGRYWYDTDYGTLSQSNGSSWQQLAGPVPQLQTLTDGATITWNLALGNGKVTLGGNRTMAAPTNLAVGVYLLQVVQDGTGSRTITWNSAFKFAGGTAPTLTTTASATDQLLFFCDGTNMYCQSTALNVH
jgi:hypothetical protein